MDQRTEHRSDDGGDVSGYLAPRFWRGWSNTPLKASSGRSEPNTSKAVFSSGSISSFSRTKRSALAFSGSPRNASARAF